MNYIYHMFHIVSTSPWPILNSFLALGLMTSLLVLFKMALVSPLLITLLLMSVFMYVWWRDISREATIVGDHSNKVQDGLKYGMSLFILSEVLFFIAWFWAFFHHSSAPTVELGGLWPPLSVTVFDPFSVPLLNTAILLSSGVFVTWAHHNIIYNKSLFYPLFSTVLLGVTFTYFQLFEYSSSLFSISDSAYGTTFFVSTGFHGLHVLIGTLFLLACLFRYALNHFIPSHHIGLEFAIWYWHFVDVVWLFLFSFVYWWGLN